MDTEDKSIDFWLPNCRCRPVIKTYTHPKTIIPPSLPRVTFGLTRFDFSLLLFSHLTVITYYIVFVCLLFVDSWQRCKPFPWQRRSFNRRPVAKVCSFFFLVLNNSLILLKRNLLLFATVGNITLLSLCVELSFLYEKMIICKSYVAGNILCEFHTCFLPEDRIYVNSREHVIWILLNFQKE
jgi:hypothetical protein